MSHTRGKPRDSHETTSRSYKKFLLLYKNVRRTTYTVWYGVSQSFRALTRCPIRQHSQINNNTLVIITDSGGGSIPPPIIPKGGIRNRSMVAEYRHPHTMSTACECTSNPGSYPKQALLTKLAVTSHPRVAMGNGSNYSQKQRKQKSSKTEE